MNGETCGSWTRRGARCKRRAKFTAIPLSGMGRPSEMTAHPDKAIRVCGTHANEMTYGGSHRITGDAP